MTTPGRMSRATVASTGEHDAVDGAPPGARRNPECERGADLILVAPRGRTQMMFDGIVE